MTFSALLVYIKYNRHLFLLGKIGF